MSLSVSWLTLAVFSPDSGSHPGTHTVKQPMGRNPGSPKGQRDSRGDAQHPHVGPHPQSHPCRRRHARQGHARSRHARPRRRHRKRAEEPLGRDAQNGAGDAGTRQRLGGDAAHRPGRVRGRDSHPGRQQEEVPLGRDARQPDGLVDAAAHPGQNTNRNASHEYGHAHTR